jgi:hypothetical protein
LDKFETFYLTRLTSFATTKHAGVVEEKSTPWKIIMIFFKTEFAAAPALINSVVHFDLARCIEKIVDQIKN